MSEANLQPQVGHHSPGVGCGNRPATWGWVDYTGPVRSRRVVGGASDSGYGLAAPASPAFVGFIHLHASQQHDLPLKEVEQWGLIVWPLGLPF